MTIDGFPHIVDVPARWGDYDMLNHLNNVSYYRFFEMVVVGFVEQIGGIDWLQDAVIPFAAESKCRFLRPLAYREPVRAGLGVENMKTRSLTYNLALYGEASPKPAAVGHFVHVFVDRESGKPTVIPEQVRHGFAEYRV